MEHEDNAHLDNFLQNSQHLMENLQMDRGDGVCDNVAVDEIGGKFEVHEEHDDEEEWKYIKEGQQSEKQQQQQQQQLKAGVACKDVEGVEEVGNGHGYGYEHGDVGADDILLLDHHEVGNGVVGISAAVNADADNAATGIVENEEVDVEIIKNDGDFSTTSNTTSTAGEDGYADTGVLQVQMQIENISQDEFLPKQVVDLLEECPNVGSHADETEEDDPSSLATNNTNRTNSLSESAPNQELQQLSTEENIIKSEEFLNDDKENTAPLISNIHGDNPFEETTGNSDFDSEMHSQLNPNAIEFVPSFGSNPTSPTTGNSDNQIFVDEEVASNSADEIQLRAQPNSLPRHLLGDDDFVAQSPRKGSAESNLDAIALPEENDFEHEAAKRPHELEQEDDLIGVGTVEHTQQKSQLTNEHLQSLNNYAANMLEIERDANEDRHNQSPLNLIDHGPETSVDLEMDLQPVDVEKDDETQYIPKENLEIIEDVFNTVQPLPIDLNSSFVEESSQQEFTVEGKELLDVEEKENISHSPSTEEMQMNLQNEFHSSVKDIPQIPIDMDNAANMQESFYLESTSSEARQQLQEPFASGIEFSAVDEPNFHTNEIQITNEEEQKPVIDDPSFDIVQISATGTFESEADTALDTSPTALNIYAPEFTPTPKSIDADIISPSPVSTEEKHLIEETKEQANLSETEEIEQKMDDLIISSNDGILSQVEEVAQTAANIVESLNPFAASEPEQHETVEETPIEANRVFSTESQPVADFSQQNEQSYYNEQQEQQHLQEETAEPTYEQHEDNLLLTKPEDVQPPAASPVQFESELNGFEEHVSAALSVENNIAAPVEPESVELPVEPALEYSHVELVESPVAQPEPEEPQVELVASPVAEPVLEVSVESPVAEPEHVAVSEPELKDVPQAEVQPFSEPEFIVQPESEVQVLPSEPVTLFDESSNFEPNVSAAVAESILESPDQHSASIPSEANVELAANESTASAVEETVITAAAVGALAATAAAVTVAADAHKKPDVKQARTPTSTKSKGVDVKKFAEPIKKPIGKTSLSTVSAARPRTAPVKTTATAEKKPTTTTGTTKSATTTAARKPLTSATATSRTVTKTTTTTTRPATAPTTAKLTASRTTTTTTARRSAPTTTGASTAATNGTATAKPKPTSGAPTKPTTLGLSGTTKPKLSSPRTTLTSQLRKAPTSTVTGVAASKSPLKTTAPAANGVTKSSTTTTTASRAKSSTSSTTTTTTTKTFTARPAPKTTHSSTITSTTTRRTVGSVSVSATAAKTSSSTLLKKTPPGTTRPTTTGKSSLSPTKTASSVLKAKTKDVTKKAVTPTKSAKELKDKHTDEQRKTNGTTTTVVGAEESAVIQTEQKPHLNGDGDALQLIENGIHKLELENGDNPLLEQHIQASLIDA